jgi:transcriptional regulator with XRE-family HTH domain
MDSAGMSLRQVARGANIPLSTFSRRLNGSPFLSTELAALASVFGVTVSQLVAEAEAIPPTTSGAA